VDALRKRSAVRSDKCQSQNQKKVGKSKILLGFPGLKRRRSVGLEQSNGAKRKGNAGKDALSVGENK
jgi:hypothetical protein